jgi:hypothetical protein
MPGQSVAVGIIETGFRGCIDVNGNEIDSAGPRSPKEMDCIPVSK